MKISYFLVILVVSLIFISAVNAQEEQTTEKKGFFWNIIQKIKSFFGFGAEKEVELEEEEEVELLDSEEDKETVDSIDVTTNEVETNEGPSTPANEPVGAVEPVVYDGPTTPGIEMELSEEEEQQLKERIRAEKRAYLKSIGSTDEEIDEYFRMLDEEGLPPETEDEPAEDPPEEEEII